ncbi:MAG: hypothetical protein GY757_04785 [bacterium]|nr:hypothetical protein [bacterium]
MLKKMNGYSLKGLILTTLFIGLLATTLKAGDRENKKVGEKIEHNVAVNAVLVPFIAKDLQWNPVFDLKSDELEIFVNDKKMAQGFLSRIAFTETKKSTTPPSD